MKCFFCHMHTHPKVVLISAISFFYAALTLQFVTNTFQEDHDPTIGESLGLCGGTGVGGKQGPIVGPGMCNSQPSPHEDITWLLASVLILSLLAVAILVKGYI